MNILIIGYGRIGSKKADIWKSLGALVHVFDPDIRRVEEATDQGFKASTIFSKIANTAGSDCMVDICSPSGEHTNSVRAILGTKAATPQAILIEKPLVSSRDELMTLEELVRARYDTSRVFVGENYYASSALTKLRKLIANEAKNGNQITAIDILFHKNRIPDIRAGRFQDGGLGAYGVEMPHMVACLKSLGLENPGVVTNHYYKNVNKIRLSEGTFVVFDYSGCNVKLLQTLGNFSFKDKNGMPKSYRGDNAIREIYMTFTDGSAVNTTFDPVSNESRYHSQIIRISPESKADYVLIQDNHLRLLLKSLLNYIVDGSKPAFFDHISYENAVDDAKMILSLRENAQIVNGSKDLTAY